MSPADSYLPSSQTCRQARDFIFDLIDSLDREIDALSNATGPTALMLPESPENKARQAFVEEHVSVCKSCLSYQQDLLQCERDLGQIPPVAIPEGLADRIMAQLISEGAFSEQDTQPDTSNTTQRGGGSSHRNVVIGPWWQRALRQPVAPAIAAVLLVVGGWALSTSMLSPGRTGHATVASIHIGAPHSVLQDGDTLGFVSDDYEMDGQQLAYVSEDRILDPTWVGTGNDDGDTATDFGIAPASQKVESIAASTVVPELDNDPLKSLVGF